MLWSVVVDERILLAVGIALSVGAIQAIGYATVGNDPRIFLLAAVRLLIPGDPRHRGRIHRRAPSPDLALGCEVVVGVPAGPDRRCGPEPGEKDQVSWNRGLAGREVTGDGALPRGQPRLAATLAGSSETPQGWPGVQARPPLEAVVASTHRYV
jgi:hypothetical protein